MENATKCYLCCVQDGNATPFDTKKHHLCPICAVKLRNMALTAPDGFCINVGPDALWLFLGEPDQDPMEEIMEELDRVEELLDELESKKQPKVSYLFNWQTLDPNKFKRED